MIHPFMYKEYFKAMQTDVEIALLKEKVRILEREVERLRTAAPEPRKAREFWILNHTAYGCEQICGRERIPYPGQIHVREVLPEDK